MGLDLDTFDCLDAAGIDSASSGSVAPISYDYNELRSALLSLPAEYSDVYDLWLKEVAIPLKHAGEELFPLFVEFSKQSSKFKGEDDCRVTWDPIKPRTSGTIKTINSIFWHAKKHGWTGSGAAPRATTLDDALARYPIRTMKELLSSDLREQYIVDGVLTQGSPAIFGGPAKSLKTAQLMDLAYNLSIGGKFLGNFQCVKCNVLILTGESGGAALQRRINAFVERSGGTIADDEAFLISEALPKFSSAPDLALLETLLAAKKSEVVIIDPVYLCMGNSDAGNIQAQGEVLWAITELCRKANVTLVVAHHVTKTAAREQRLLTLEDLSQAGFDAWARQWWLVSRREEFELGSGVHRLQVAAGNCSSHSMEWAVDIDEGTKDDPKWDVKVSSLSALNREAHAQKESAQLEKGILKIQRALQPAGSTLSKSELRDKAGISGQRWRDCFETALTREVIKKVSGKRANTSHYALAS